MFCLAALPGASWQSSKLHRLNQWPPRRQPRRFAGGIGQVFQLVYLGCGDPAMASQELEKHAGPMSFQSLSLSISMGCAGCGLGRVAGKGRAAAVSDSSQCLVCKDEGATIVRGSGQFAAFEESIESSRKMVWICLHALLCGLLGPTTGVIEKEP